MDTTFSRQELRELDPADLRGLLELADGETDLQKAMSLGLDPTSPVDRDAVIRAMGTVSDQGPDAGESGVRLDLSPNAPGGPAHPDGLDTPSSTALAPAETAASIRDKMAASAATGDPFMAGTFALYAAPSGELVLVTQDQQDRVNRSVVPRKAVQMALALIAGEKTGVVGMLARKFGRG